MNRKNPPWANWGTIFYVNGRERTKFYRTEIGARIFVKYQTFRDRDVMLFRIVREEYRVFHDFLTKELMD